MSQGPPRLLVHLLEAVLPRGVVGRSMVGDLLEEWHRRPPGAGRTAWFVLVVAALGLRYAGARSLATASAAVGATASAFRRALRNPLQTGFTVVALGIGIAAPATMYSIVAGITRNVDVEEPDRLVQVGRRYSPTDVGITRLDHLWPAVGEMEGVSAAGVFSREWADLSDEGRPAERVQMGRVTPGVFRAFAADAVIGRTFTADDAGLDPAPVVLGWELWQSRFGADRSVLGHTVRLDGAARVVVGVMGEGFRSPGGVQLWAHLDADDPALAGLGVEAVARLAPGASLDVVRAQVAAFDEALAERGEDVSREGTLAARSWRDGLVAPQHRRMLTVMLVVVGFVLVIACSDVLHLMLARALSRSRETAVRVALGAGRGRIVGAHLAEAAVLSALAGLVALGLTALAVRIFAAETAGSLAHWMDVRVDLPVLAFGAGMVALAALGTGLVPAVQSGRLDPGPALRDGGRGASAFRIGGLGRALVAGEIALSCALLVMAGIMVKGAIANLRSDGAYATSTVLTAHYQLRPDAYDDAAVPAFHRRLVESLAGHPGVERVAVGAYLPGVYSLPARVEVSGQEAERVEDLPRTHAVVVSPGFFESVESGVLRGRDFTWADGADGHLPVVVNEAFVRKHLDGAEALGARLRLVTGGARDDTPWATVVGVVPALGIGVGRAGDDTGVYAPASVAAIGARLPTRRMAVVLRAAPGTDPLALVPTVRQAVSGLDPDIALFDVSTLEEQIRETRVAESAFATLFLVFGLSGLVLAGVGLYGVMAFGVRRRTRELGVRTALGASRARVLRTAVGGGLIQLVAGLAAGLALAGLVAPLLGELLLGMDPRDPTVYASVTAVLAATGLTAAAAPARRALKVDVVEALRTE